MNNVQSYLLENSPIFCKEIEKSFLAYKEFLYYGKEWM